MRITRSIPGVVAKLLKEDEQMETPDRQGPTVLVPLYTKQVISPPPQELFVCLPLVSTANTKSLLEIFFYSRQTAQERIPRVSKQENQG